MTAPTPGPSVHGPWIEHAEVPHTVYGSDGYQVCRLMRGNRPSSETEAIRRLIVSAPALQAENARLREALEQVDRTVAYGDYPDALYAKVRAALKGGAE